MLNDFFSRKDAKEAKAQRVVEYFLCAFGFQLCAFA
jgi:hypothetical protein